MAGVSNQRRSRTPSDDPQLLLPFSKPDDLRVALSSIDRCLPAVAEHVKSSATWRQVCEVVKAVWFCGRENGCRAYVSTLIRVANENSPPDRPVIRNRRHFFKVLAVARALGLILSESDWNEGKRAPSERDVGESRIAELVALTREFHRAQKRHHRGTNAAPSVHHRGTNTHLSETAEACETFVTKKTLKTSTPAGDDAEWSKAVEELHSLGIINAADAARTMRDHGAAVGDLRSLIDFWLPRRDGWQSPGGILVHRMRSWAPSQPPDAGWPPPRPDANTRGTSSTCFEFDPSQEDPADGR